MDIPIFEGGVCYTQKEMTELFKHITYHDNFSILEFATGNSTLKLHSHFKKHVENLVFYSYDSDSRFFRPINIQNEQRSPIDFIYYNDPDIKSVELPPIKFDLILVDGSNEDKRAIWCSKFKNNIKNGTIIVFDYFNHFTCSSDELDKHFDYELLGSNTEPFVAYGEHSWKIIRIKQ